MSDRPCPVCERPGNYTWQGNREEQCEMWTTMEYGRCHPSQSAFNDCYRHAKPWRQKFLGAMAEIAELKLKLATAQRALSRHHEAQAGKDMFPDNARIE